METMNKFIRKVTIKNFLTYKNVIIPNFDPEINLIFGQNGSGKTSFFRSIEFALTENIKYTKQLFDRLASDRNLKELFVSVQLSNNYVFTRKLNPQGQCFLINDKIVTHVSFLNLVKYYYMDENILVPQGEINLLIGTPERLSNELIKFIISMNNVDELKDLIEQVINRFDSINELRSSLFDNLEAMQEDKFLMEKISVIKDEIRIIHTVIQSRKIDSLQHRIENKKNNYEQVKSELNELIEEQMRKTEKLNELKQLVEDEDVQNGSFNEENFKELTTKKAQSDLEAADCRKHLKEKKEEHAKLVEQFLLLKKNIDSKQCTLEQLKPKLEQFKEQEKSIQKQIAIKRLEIDQLFSPDNQQDDVLKAEMERSILDLQSELDMLNKNISELTDKKEQNGWLVEKCVADQIEFNKIIEDENQNISKFTNENLNLEMMRRKLCAQIDEHRDTLDKCMDKKRSFYPLIGRAILKGRENLDKVIEMFKNGSDEEKQIVDNYYGWFIDNISFDNSFTLPIERTSRQYLHKHIVKDLNTANRLLKKFDEMKLHGTLEFVALDLLKIKNIPLETDSSVYQPLINYIKYEKKMELAVRSCFQRVYICRSIEEVIGLKKNFTFVTLDGDLLFKSRSLNGGYIDKNRIWLAHYSKYQICEEFRLEILEKLNKLNQDLRNCENDLEQNYIKSDESEYLKSKQHLERCELRSELIKIESEIEESTQLIKNYKQMYKRKLSELEDLKSKLEMVINRHELNESERLNKISSLQAELEKLDNEYGLVIEKCNQIKLETKALKIDLKENLLKQKTDLSKNLKKCQLKISVLETRLSNLQSTIKILKDSIDEMLKRKSVPHTDSQSDSQSDSQGDSQNSYQTDSQASTSSHKLEKQLDLLEKKRQISQLEHSIEQITFEEIELKSQLKDNLHMQKTYRDEIILYENQLKKLAGKADQYLELDLKTLMAKMKELRDEIAAIGNLRAPLISSDLNEARYIDINDSFVSLRDLMTSAIEFFKSEIHVERSLQTLSLFFMRFEQIFTMFKANSKVQVHIQVPPNTVTSDGVSEKFSAHDLRSELYVSFAGERPRPIDFCSGGQKTTLSLCYLLSILTLRPQPFLMIDETDQHLDGETCLKLGSILRENFANQTQFFFSSNRPYFTSFARKFFKVSIDKNQSNISQVDSFKLPQFDRYGTSIRISQLIGRPDETEEH